MNVFDLSAKIAMDINGYLKGMDTAKGVAISTLSVIGGALDSFMSNSIEVGKKFDSSMSQVYATMGDKAEKTMEKGAYAGQTQAKALRDFAQEMGRTTAFTANQAADALNYMALAGYDAEQSMQALPDVLNLAAAGSMDLATASDMVTDTQTAFGISAGRVTQMIDEMAKASSTGNTSVQQMGEAFLVVGGLAQELNGGLITLEDGTTRTVDGVQELEIALTAMANAGIKGSEAGTHMRNMLLKLSSPTEEGAKALTKLGIDVFDKVSGNMRSLSDIFSELNVELSKMSQEEKIQTISKLFNTRDLASAEAILNAVSSDWNAIGTEILNAHGAAEKMAKTQLDNLAGDTKLFESALEGLQIALSDGATPALRDMTQLGTDMISDLTERFKDLPPQAQTAISLIATFGSKVAAAAPQILGLASNIAQLKIAKTVAGDTNALGGSLSALAGPAGIAAAAIAVVAIAYVGYTEKLKNATEAEQELLDSMTNEASVYDATHQRVQTLLDDNNQYRTSTEALNELEGMRVGIMDTYNEATRRRSEAYEELKDVEAKLAVAESDLTTTFEYGDGQMLDYTYDADILREKQEKLNAIIAEADGVITDTTGDLDAINYAIEYSTTVVEDNSSAVDEACIAYGQFGEGISEDMKNTMRTVVDSVLGMQEALSSSVSSIGNWFDAVEQQEAQSADNMKANLRAQIDQVKNWEKDLAYLGDLGINKEFLTYLANMGPKGYQYVLAMKEDVISGGQATVDEWNALYNEKLALEEGINSDAENVYDAIVKMESGGAYKFEQMADLFGVKGAKIGQNTTLGMIKELDSAVTKLEEAGKSDGEAVIDGMEDGTDSHSPSRAAMTVGKNVGTGLTQGLNNQKSAIKAAGQALGKAAVEGIIGQQGAVSTFGVTIGRAVVSGINSYQGAVSGAGANLARSALNGANSVNLQGNGYNIGMYFVLGMRNGIYDYSHAALSAAQSVAYNMMNSVRSIMRIGSPSKVAEYFGEMWDAGLEEGITVNAEAPVEATRTMTENVVGATRQGLIAPSLDYSGYAQDVSEGGMAGTEEPVAPVNVTMNIYGSEGQDVRELAMIVSQELAMIMRENQAVWA